MPSIIGWFTNNDANERPLYITIDTNDYKHNSVSFDWERTYVWDDDNRYYASIDSGDTSYSFRYDGAHFTLCRDDELVFYSEDCYSFARDEGNESYISEFNFYRGKYGRTRFFIWNAPGMDANENPIYWDYQYRLWYEKRTGDSTQPLTANEYTWYNLNPIKEGDMLFYAWLQAKDMHFSGSEETHDGLYGVLTNEASEGRRNKLLYITRHKCHRYDYSNNFSLWSSPYDGYPEGGWVTELSGSEIEEIYNHDTIYQIGE